LSPLRIFSNLHRTLQHERVGFNVKEYVDYYDDDNNNATVVCGLEYDTYSGESVEDYAFDVQYIMICYFLTVIPLFLTFVMVMAKFSVDKIRGGPWRCLDHSLAVAYVSILSITTFVVLCFAAQVLNAYYDMSSECREESEAAYPVAHKFIVSSIVFLFVSIHLSS
jgi:hypothetical protein